LDKVAFQWRLPVDGNRDDWRMSEYREQIRFAALEFWYDRKACSGWTAQSVLTNIKVAWVVFKNDIHIYLFICCQF